MRAKALHTVRGIVITILFQKNVQVSRKNNYTITLHPSSVQTEDPERPSRT